MVGGGRNGSAKQDWDRRQVGSRLQLVVAAVNPSMMDTSPRLTRIAPYSALLYYPSATPTMRVLVAARTEQGTVTADPEETDGCDLALAGSDGGVR
jgi:hypothetical protein